MTTRVSGIEYFGHTLTESRICYKARLESLEVEMVIYDNHEAFAKIKEMVAENKSWTKIHDYLMSLVLPDLPVRHLITVLSNQYQKGYRNGQADKQEEIRRVLGLRE